MLAGLLTVERCLREIDREAGLKIFGGLRPRAWICAGAGFSREDVKALLLSQGIAFTGDSVQTFSSLSARIAGVDSDRVLQGPARQEVLRLLLSVARFRESLESSDFKELKRLKRQSAFLRRLDGAIQAGRAAFAHWEEAEVYSERLDQLNPGLGADAGSVRREIEALARAYEEWLTQSGYWDPPLVARLAVERLSSGAEISLPQRIYHFSAQTQESLEKSFWEALSVRTEVVKLALSDFSAERSSSESSECKVRWQKWHTLDDAAEALCDELSGLRNAVVLIPDAPSARRSLRRSLEQAGIPLADSRDPTRIRWDEAVKWAILPLEMVARGFERSRVIAWVHRFSRSAERVPGTLEIREIHDRGIRQGLGSYSGGKLTALHQELVQLGEKLGGKKTVLELAKAHLDYLERELARQSEFIRVPGRVPGGALGWVVGFFEGIWKELARDLERVGLGERRAAPLYWLERLQQRVSESQAPVERLKPETGLDVYRLHQAPPRDYEKVLVFGLPPLWLAPTSGGVGDYWFSEREREILAGEFAVRSGMQIRSERIDALRAWFAHAREVIFLDAAYEADGRERESIRSVLEELRCLSVIGPGIDVPDERGSHSRWLASFGALRPVPPQEAKLEPLADPARISASALDNYSRCGFLALARNRWRLEDLAEPDTDLWPQIKGILLHEAVRALIESRNAEGGFSKSVPESIQEAIEIAWKEVAIGGKRPRGLLRGARIEAYVKRKLAMLLRVFVEQERKYAQRSKTRVIGLENVEFQVDYRSGDRSFSIVGEPDRIDEHPDGLWIIDYKTSSQAPNGSTMLERGYRLQLPFYALAAQRKFGKPALGFQFVQLDRKGTRTNGVYFKSHNGKEAGKLTDTTARSKSLLNLPREEVWAEFERQIEEQSARYAAGEFTAMPRISPRSKECASCPVNDFCGYRRLMEETESDQKAGDES